jgi:hypothetical protein
VDFGRCRNPHAFGTNVRSPYNTSRWASAPRPSGERSAGFLHSVLGNDHKRNVNFTQTDQTYPSRSSSFMYVESLVPFVLFVGVLVPPAAAPGRSAAARSEPLPRPALTTVGPGGLLFVFPGLPAPMVQGLGPPVMRRTGTRGSADATSCAPSGRHAAPAPVVSSCRVVSTPARPCTPGPPERRCAAAVAVAADADADFFCSSFNATRSLAFSPAAPNAMPAARENRGPRNPARWRRAQGGVVLGRFGEQGGCGRILLLLPHPAAAAAAAPPSSSSSRCRQLAPRSHEFAVEPRHAARGEDPSRRLLGSSVIIVVVDDDPRINPLLLVKLRYVNTSSSSSSPPPLIQGRRRRCCCCCCYCCCCCFISLECLWSRQSSRSSAAAEGVHHFFRHHRGRRRRRRCLRRTAAVVVVVVAPRRGMTATDPTPLRL